MLEPAVPSMYPHKNGQKHGCYRHSSFPFDIEMNRVENSAQKQQQSWIQLPRRTEMKRVQQTQEHRWIVRKNPMEFSSTTIRGEMDVQMRSREALIENGSPNELKIHQQCLPATMDIQSIQGKGNPRMQTMTLVEVVNSFQR
jgi:hypothetical protein